MAAHGWRADYSIEEFLFQRGYRFDFYQAVRLLEIMNPDRTGVGEGSEPDKEPVRFHSKVSFAFPASDLDEVEPTAPGERTARMTVNFMGLAGSTGPLPEPYTELILKRAARKDTAFRDFLDIFNHRLVSLFYRVRKTMRIGFEPVPPDRARFARYLFSLFGMGTEGLRGRMAVPDRALLQYAGLLAQQPRSMAGLERMLTDYFAVPVRGVPFQGRWYRIDPDQQTRIGITGANQVLGRSAVLGERVWSHQGKIDIAIGPSPLSFFLDFLPIGSAYRPLCELARFYLGPEIEFVFRLSVEARQAPAARLSSAPEAGGTRLGWTSWLGHAGDGDATVRIAPHRLGPETYPDHIRNAWRTPAEENDPARAA